MHRLVALALATSMAFAASLSGQIDPGLLKGLTARSIGPAAMSGRVSDVAGVESNPDILYVATASGGVWKSINGGLNWNPVFDEQPVASTGSVAVFQANPDIVWVGTGEGNPRNSAFGGGGIYRSLDSGRSWKQLGLEKTERIHRVVLHPSNPDVAYAAAMGRLWGENPERGVFKTVDGGKTWKKVLYANEQTGAADLVMDPSNPNKLFAAMWNHRRWPWSFRSGGPGSGLYVTYDGGDSWKQLTEDDGLPKGGLGRIGVAISRSNPEIVYALVEAEESALVQSTDGGRTWKTVNDDPRTANRPFYYADIKVDPVWPNRVYNLTSRLTVSNDGGRTFAVLPGSRTIHGDYHALWINPADPRHMVAGEDGGLGISRDRGETWFFVANLPLGQFYHVSVDNEMPYNVYGGLQDNGSWRGPSSVWEEGGDIRNHQWARIGGGDGFDVIADPEDAMTGYSESQGGFLMRWNLRTGQQQGIRPPEIDPENPETRLRYNWNTGLAVDPFEPATIYYGSQFVHKSTDRGETWSIVSPDLTTDNPEWQKQGESGGITPDVTGAEMFTAILAIAPSPLQRGVIWVGTDDGRIQLTRDGGKTWDSVEKNLKGAAAPPANTWIPHIRPSRFDPASAFVVFDNHRRDDNASYVFRTDDWGKTWTSLVAPRGPVRGFALAIEQDSVKKELLFLGTEHGLYVSTDAGANWMQWRHGLPASAPVMDLALQTRENDLVIGAHGRSLYILDDITPLRELSKATIDEPLHLYPASVAWLRGDGGGRGNLRGGNGEFSGESRPYGVLLTYSLNGPGLPLPDEDQERARKEKERAASPASPEAKSEEKDGDRKPKEPKVKIEIADAAGKVVRTLEAPARLGLNRAVWDLGRDAFRQPATDNRGFQRRDESGPEVPPGTYTVTARFADSKGESHETRSTVTVTPIPLIEGDAAGWQAREAAIARLGTLQNAAVEAVERIAAARKDVDVVLQKLEPKDKKKTPPEGQEDPNKALKEAARNLQKKLKEMDGRLRVSPEIRGIVDDQTVLARIDSALFPVLSSWKAPSPTSKSFVDQAEAAARKTLADVNQLFAQDVAAFRQQVQSSGIGLLADQAPISVD